MTSYMADIANAAGLGVAVALSLGVMLIILCRPWRPARKPDLVLPAEPPPPPLAEAHALQAWMVTLVPQSGVAAARGAPDTGADTGSDTDADTGACIIPLFPDSPAPGGPSPVGNTQPLRRRA